jgi:hypothetical protein
MRLSNPYNYTGGLGAPFDHSAMDPGLYLLLTPGKENPNYASNISETQYSPVQDLPRVYAPFDLRSKSSIMHHNSSNRLSAGLFIHLTRHILCITHNTHAAAKYLVERSTDGTYLVLLLGPFFSPLDHFDEHFHCSSLYCHSAFQDFLQQFSTHLWGYHTSRRPQNVRVLNLPPPPVPPSLNLSNSFLYTLFKETKLDSVAIKGLIYEIIDAQRYALFYRRMAAQEAGMKEFETLEDCNDGSLESLSHQRASYQKYKDCKREFTKNQGTVRRIINRMLKQDRKAVGQLDLLSLQEADQPMIKSFFSIRSS